MFTFIINPASRSGLGRQVWERLEPVLDRRGISYKAYMTCCQRHATRLARELTADGREQTLVVLGGDGTLNEVVNGIQCFSGTTLGYIPVGSGNDFARFFHFPSDPEEALSLILDCHPSYADMNIGNLVFRGQEKRFAVSAGLGFDAAICHQAVISRLKPVLNRLHLGKLTYALIALDRLHFLRPARVTVTFDDRTSRSFTDTLFVTVMNHPYEGGGFKFCPGADPCDDRLDVIVVSGISRLKAVLLLLLSQKAAHTGARGIFIRSCRRVRIESDTSLPVHTDGEPVFLQRRMDASLLQERLRVIVPRDSAPIPGAPDKTTKERSRT